MSLLHSHLLLFLLIVVLLIRPNISTSSHTHNDDDDDDEPKHQKNFAQHDEHEHQEARDVSNMVASMRESGSSSKMEADNSRTVDWQLYLDAPDINSSSSNENSNENNKSRSFRLGTDVFALGFSERGSMASSDFCILWYDLSHRLHLQDAQTNAANELELIEKGESVCKLVAVEEKSETHSDYEPMNESVRFAPLKISFARALEVCHHENNARQQHYYAIDNGTTHLIWFTLRGPMLALDGLNLSSIIGDGNGHSKSHHDHDDSTKSLAQFGMRRVQLIGAQRRRHAAVVNNNSAKQHASRVLDIRMDKFEVPASETTYMCKLFKLPERFSRRRYHITSYEALIEPEGMEQIVHHMELFNCANLAPDEEQTLEDLVENKSNNNNTGECSTFMSAHKATRSCRRVILAWAMGARPLVYPEQVGQSIGGKSYSPYVMLEVHYNNVALSSGFLDSSGLRFHYSSRLRPFDAGVLEVGLEYTDKNSIPPKMVTPLAGHCVSECTRAAFSSSSSSSSSANTNANAANELGANDGIFVFAAQMHTHLTGVASWTEHVRGGELLGELQRDDHYSPHFQEIRLLPEPVHLEPGDALIHYCRYDTRARENITLGGFATTDEMCVTYLHYYPKLDLEVCKSSVDSRALEEYFDELSQQENQPTSSGANNNNKSVTQQYQSIEWSARRARELIEFYEHAPLSIQCNRSDGRPWPGQWQGIEQTKIRRRRLNLNLQDKHSKSKRCNS